jgi:hypothetical protein
MNSTNSFSKKSVSQKMSFKKRDILQDKDSSHDFAHVSDSDLLRIAFSGKTEHFQFINST